jgi:hypothetical protein
MQMRQEPIDVVEALSVLMDLMDLADGPENQAELDELTGVILKLIPDYLAVYPEKKQAVLAVLNRSSGVRVTDLDSALAWYSKQPEAPMPTREPTQPVQPDVPKPKDPVPARLSEQARPKVQKQKPDPELAPSSVRSRPVLLDRFKRWMRGKPEAPQVTLPDADEKRAALLKKLEAIRDGQNPFS